MSGLLELADRVEAAGGADRVLLRDVALAVGWHRYSPSEIGKKNPGWIAPEDYIGEYVGKDGRRTPKLDSLHGTTIWRDPIDYLASLDAALTLVPVGLRWCVDTCDGKPRSFVEPLHPYDGQPWWGNAATPALALVSAALRARHALTEGTSNE